MNAPSSLVTLSLLEIREYRPELPPYFPINKLFVSPSADYLQTLACFHGNAESFGAEDETNAEGLDGEKEAD